MGWGVVVSGGRVVGVYLGLHKGKPPAPVEKVSSLLGVRAVLWTPADLPSIRAELGMPS